MHSNHGAVDEHIFEIRVAGKRLEDGGPDFALLPAGKAFVHGIPGAELLRQITPRRTGAQDPQHGLHEQPVVVGRAPRIGGFAWQQVGDPLPLVFPLVDSGHSFT